MDYVNLLFWLLFFVSAIALSGIILMQDSGGGGLAEAFGGVGAETFGVKASGAARVTFFLAVVFAVSALMVHLTW
ncbi:MAG: preprotein translocase subunit SecG [Planctomycetota bacterium]